MAKSPDALYRFIRWFARVMVFRLGGGLRVLHHERVPTEGAVIIAPNHVSFLDPPAIAVTLRRPVRFMAQAALFKPPGFGWLIRRLGSFPVNRGAADMAAIRTALDALAAGEMLLVFPEGRRGEGVSLSEAEKGAGLLASKSGAAVVPVGIVGTGRRLPKGGKLPRFGRVTVVYGEPIFFRDFEGDPDPKLRFGKELMARISDLMSEGKR